MWRYVKWLWPLFSSGNGSGSSSISCITGVRHHCVCVRVQVFWADNPRDLQLLRHDKSLHTIKTKPHLRNVPDYLGLCWTRDSYTVMIPTLWECGDSHTVGMWWFPHCGNVVIPTLWWFPQCGNVVFPTLWWFSHCGSQLLLNWVQQFQFITKKPFWNLSFGLTEYTRSHNHFTAITLVNLC